MIMSEARDGRIADQVQPAIPDVRVVEQVVEQSNRSARGPHTVQVRVLGSILLDTIVGGLKTREQPGAGIANGRIGIQFFDRLHRDAAGFLAAFISAHAVGHDGQPALQRELLIAGRFPVGIAVFIVISLAADITEARQLNTEPNSHSTSLQCKIRKRDLGLYRTESARMTKAGMTLRFATRK